MRDGRKDLTDNAEHRQGVPEVEFFQGTKTPLFRSLRTMSFLLLESSLSKVGFA